MLYQRGTFAPHRVNSSNYCPASDLRARVTFVVEVQNEVAVLLCVGTREPNRPIESIFVHVSIEQ